MINTIKELYKEKDVIPGGTAGAVRHELRTGKLVGGKVHITKAQEKVRNLEKIIMMESLNSAEREIVQYLLQDLKNALAGK